MLASLSSITNPGRLAVLQRVRLMDSPQDPVFDRMTRLAARFLHVPIVHLSLIDADRQFFLSCVGLPEPVGPSRETPLSHSLCKHVVTTNAPLIVRDAREDPLVRDNQAVTEYHVVAYAGIPLTTLDGYTLGAFAALDYRPRDWTEDDISLLTELTKAAMVDIELRMQHEVLTSAELHARDELLHSAFYDAAIGMAVVGLDGQWLQVNAALSEIVGYSETELLALDFQAITHPDDLDGDLALLRQLLAGTIRTYQMEKRYRHKHVRTVWVLLNVSLVRDNAGRPLHCVSQIQDITARKQALHDLELARIAAEQGNRAKSQFMATMSHEFRTPLHAITGMTELLLGTSLDDEQQMYATTVRDAGQSLGRILNDILDFVTIESETLELAEVPFDPRVMVEQVVAMVRPSCAAKRVELSMTVDPQVPASLYGDQGRVHQILLHLLGNAAKFTEHGGIHVNVQAYTLGPQQTLVEFEVRDTGIGLPEDVRSHLFQPFTQADGSWSRRYGGLGLGLALAQRLVELMNGSIGVRSEEGHGSIFTIKIPFKDVQMTSIPPKSEPIPVTDDPCSTGVILVAEDNLVNQRLVLLQLRKLGYQAESVSDGYAAVEAVQHGRYALVLMDCQMPGMDGLTATVAIREMECTMPDVRRLPIIALTANAMEGDRETCLQAGMDDYLSKPVKVDVLDGMIKRWLFAQH